jgi:hypothetical protein
MFRASAAIASSIDPYLMNEYPPQGVAGVGYSVISGRTQKASIVSDRPNTGIVIIDGQSEHATANGTTAYTMVNAAAHQLNVYDGGIYDIIDPPLGCSHAPTVGPTGPVGPFADRPISQGKKTRMIVVPIAIGGTPWAIYDPTATGSLFTRTRCAIRRLLAHGLEPDFIISGRGATDNTLGTSRASIRASVNAYINGVRAMGCTSPIYLGKFTMVSGATSANVQNGIADAISDNAGNGVFAGYDGDTNATVAGGYRLPDQTHLSNTGRTLVGHGWADLLFP